MQKLLRDELKLRNVGWKPIGMEYDGSWSMDSQESGFERMESGINARAIDFAKFGRLYLYNGSWNGRQVIDSAWVAQSTQEDRSIDRAVYYPQKVLMENGYYKYFWWGNRRDDGSYDFSAQGYLGQWIYVSPQADLIIVRNGKKELPKEWGPPMSQFIRAMGKNVNKTEARV